MTTAVQELKNTSFELFAVRTLLQALQALSFGTKQVIRIAVTDTGIEFQCEDAGKVSQSFVRFPASFFTSYEFSGEASTFSVQLSTFVDALKVFVAIPNIVVRFTETKEHLVLEASDEEADGQSVCMYAHLSILHATHVQSLLDHWQEPATAFTIESTVLKEAVEDLEWPQGPVKVEVKAQPMQVVLSAKGTTGELDITLPPAQIRHASTHAQLVAYKYNYKHMKTALQGPQTSRTDLLSRVSMDANGLLEAVHSLSPPRHHSSSQGAGDEQGDVALTYMIQPMYEAALDGLQRDRDGAS